MKARLALGVLLCTLAVPASDASAVAAVTFFHSPSGNIQCEVRSGYAYCQTSSPARSVKLVAAGTYRVCKGVRCVGDGPTNAFTLGYGRSATVGPFRCTSLRSGMRCVVLRTGRGFVLSRAGAARV